MLKRAVTQEAGHVRVERFRYAVCKHLETIVGGMHSVSLEDALDLQEEG